MRQAVIVSLVAVLFVVSIGVILLTRDGDDMGGMGGMGEMTTGSPLVPPVKGFSEGHEILFIHTEASDEQVAKMLTEMMQSPVLVVPSLAKTPEAALAPVYVFTNGVRGEGPFGFQADVFPHPPGTDGYRPLRALHLVSWRDGASPRVLRSAVDVEKARQSNEITIERPSAVVNMPFLSWPGGQR